MSLIDFISNNIVVIGIIVFLIIWLFLAYTAVSNLNKENDDLRHEKYALENEKRELKESNEKIDTENRNLVISLKLLNKSLLETDSKVNELKKIEKENSINKKLIASYENKHYLPMYDKSVFETKNIQMTYEGVMKTHKLNHNSVEYITFVNILLYIDSIKYFNMYIDEIYIDEKCYVNVVQLDQLLLEFSRNLVQTKSYNFELYLAGIFIIMGYSYALQRLKTPKKVGYPFAKTLANGFLSMHFQDDAYIDKIINHINNAQHKYVDSLYHFIGTLVSQLNSEQYNLADFEKVFVPIVNFKPKSVCNTLISIVEK